MAFESIEPISLSTAPGRIADVIRSSILDGSFPPGAQLTETQLADRLSVSRGPVREAMQRLVQEGLLWTKPHHGTFVVDLGREDVADIYLTRRAVEGTAAVRLMSLPDKAAALRALEQAIEGIETAIEAGGWIDMVHADAHFHEILVNSARSVRLTRMFRTLTAETRLCMAALVEGNPSWPTTAVREHRELVAALWRGDRQQMQKLVDEHFALDETLEYRGDFARRESRQSRA
ncbi:GntR family transcriptional regulator [Mycolicibacterium litorale]|uniref:GntR family transcriptional regulator n=2 Tax=Mycolicibacterium litorale TaxID=758802 RepID=A0A6S6NY51_9MYCO|nr:GntR family transcriptional regulator [Mycolicibacterium litorale]BCI52293.1 GntR family transcriptional regulator [Mycolicibacterium litorale]